MFADEGGLIWIPGDIGHQCVRARKDDEKLPVAILTNFGKDEV